MDLKKVWEACIEMWEWIVEHLDEGTVAELKARYCLEHNIKIAVSSNCNFCEYALTEGSCHDNCPGKLVDRSFSCCWPEYHYSWKPVAFLAKLKELFIIFKETQNDYVG